MERRADGSVWLRYRQSPPVEAHARPLPEKSQPFTIGRR
jgi:hypothetical protein